MIRRPNGNMSGGVCEILYSDPALNLQWKAFLAHARTPKASSRKDDQQNLKAMKEMANLRVGKASLDMAISLDKTLDVMTDEGFSLAKPVKRCLPGNPVELHPPEARKRKKLVIKSDMAKVGIAPLYYLIYGQPGIRGFHVSDPLHDKWNVAWAALEAAGVTSFHLSSGKQKTSLSLHIYIYI